MVRDSGTGIPQQIQSKIFDPFFTTKEIGQGSGQGLSLAHAVVVGQHGGSITFDTLADVGTTFYVHLPLAGLRAQAATPTSQASQH